jgi:hypothetical protein
VNSFVPFQQFMDQLSAAKPSIARFESPTDSNSAAPALAADPDLEFLSVNDFLVSRYNNVEVSNSFADAAGQPIDCIRITQQPSLAGRNQPDAPPDELFDAALSPRRGAKASVALAPLAEGRKDQFGNDAHCPPGYIPLMRITPERIKSAGGLANLFKKAPGGGRHPTLGSAPSARQRAVSTGGPAVPFQADNQGAIHAYAHASQSVVGSACTGARSWINLWTPDPTPGVFSLSQQWLAGGSGPSLQTIEGGCHVYPSFYNDPAPITRLFTYWTADGYATTGSYNLLNQPGQPGFVQTDNTWVLGGAFQSVSQPGGDQPGFLMQWMRDSSNGNWWLTLQSTGNPVAVGYFPAANYGGGVLSQAAQNVDFGGEVCSQIGSGQTGQMGSGAYSSAGWQQAAFHKQIAYYSAGSWVPATLAPYQDAPSYTIDLHNNTTSDWSTYFFFGGPSGQFP